MVRVWPGWTMIRRPRCRALAGTPCCTIASLTACSGHPDDNVCCSQRAQQPGSALPNAYRPGCDEGAAISSSQVITSIVPRLITDRSRSGEELLPGTSVRRRCPPPESCALEEKKEGKKYTTARK